MYGSLSSGRGSGRSFRSINQVPPPAEEFGTVNNHAKWLTNAVHRCWVVLGIQNPLALCVHPASSVVVSTLRPSQPWFGVVCEA